MKKGASMAPVGYPRPKTRDAKCWIPSLPHCWVDWNFARLAAKSSSCFARSSSSVIPDCSSLETFLSRSCRFNIELGFSVRVIVGRGEGYLGLVNLALGVKRTFCWALWSFNTSSTSAVKFSKPSRWKVCSPSRLTAESSWIRTFSAVMICSGAIVFLDSSSQTSFASEAIKWINSVAGFDFEFRLRKEGQRRRREKTEWSVLVQAKTRFEPCSPTQHSMTRSRVSFAHVTSFGRSSKMVRWARNAVLVRARSTRTRNHLWNRCLG